MQLEKSLHRCLQQKLKAFKKSLVDQIQDTLNHSGKQLKNKKTNKQKKHPITY